MTRTSIRAACTAESFLTVYIQTDCSPCEHRIWESNWESKLERARTFLAKLIEKRMRGVDEISTLVRELNEQYHVACWDARNMPLHAFKKSVARVNVSDHKTARSPLIQEVRPEDVVDPKERMKDWSEMDENDYDGDYIASTDPIHPVSTDYSHPFDDDDGSWILNHFSQEEMDASSNGDVVLDFDHDGWSWDNNDNEKSTTTTFNTTQEDDPTTRISNDNLIPWNPEATTPPTLTETSTKDLHIKEKLKQEHTELIIKAFALFVHSSTNSKSPQPEHLPENITSLLRTLDIPPTTPTLCTTPTINSPRISCVYNSSHSPAPQTGRAISRTLSSADSSTSPQASSLTSPSSFSSPTPPSSSAITPTHTPRLQPRNSQRTVYDKQRSSLKKRLQLDADKDKYYRDLLLVSRWEARAFEGAEGRLIPDPLMVEEAGGRSEGEVMRGFQ